MRTTIDLPEPLLQVARHLARHSGRSVSATVAALMQRGLEADASLDLSAGSTTPTSVPLHPATGLPLCRSRRVVTAEDVAALEGEA